MEKKPIVAIDGPAGSGKSTVARAVAERLGLIYLNTGAMYRALTLKAMREGLDLTDRAALIDASGRAEIRFRKCDGGEPRVFLDGEDVSEAIRTPEVTENVRHIADVEEIRGVMVAQQQAIGREGGIALEGRDTTTVVFPDAEHKFYLDASIEERANRRFKDYQKTGKEISFEEVLRAEADRDAKDRARRMGGLRLAEGAVRVDTTDLTIEEVVEKVLSLIGESDSG